MPATTPAPGRRAAAAHGRHLRWLTTCVLAAMPGLPACGLEVTATETVDLGDHFESPDISLDDDFFYCVIQPEVLTAFSCAGGISSDSGGCHESRSALRLSIVPEPPRCQDGRLVGAPSLEAMANLERVQVSVQVDPDSSPLYRRPVGLDSHPRTIFEEDDPAAQAIRQWILMGAP